MKRLVPGDPDVADGVLLAATGDGVFGSADFGTTWVDCSNGLPKWPNGRALQITTAGEEPTVYFATYGWGVFRASLRADDTFHIPEIDKKQVKILFGIIQDGDGIEIVGNALHRVPPRGPARELALALAINVLASRLDDPAAPGLAARSGELVRRLAYLARH